MLRDDPANRRFAARRPDKPWGGPLAGNSRPGCGNKRSGWRRPRTRCPRIPHSVFLRQILADAADPEKTGKHLNRRTLAYFSLLGLTGIALSMPILQLSILYAGSGVAAVLFSCNPVFVTFLAFFLLGEPIRPRHIAALLLEVAGTVAIISPWNTRLSMTGVALALLSTLLFSVYGVMGKRKCAEYGGVVVTCFSFLFGSLITLALILLTHIPAVASALTAAGLSSFANIPILAGYTLQNLPCVLYVSAGVAGIGFCAYFLAMESQPASVVSLIYFFKPALSPLLALWLHGETISFNMGQALFSSWRGP
ncbi:DMT family transporter, partial [bacterium]|nr:DMT family transporter [bacterium]